MSRAIISIIPDVTRTSVKATNVAVDATQTIGKLNLIAKSVDDLVITSTLPNKLKLIDDIAESLPNINKTVLNNLDESFLKYIYQNPSLFRKLDNPTPLSVVQFSNKIRNIDPTFFKQLDELNPLQFRSVIGLPDDELIKLKNLDDLFKKYPSIKLMQPPPFPKNTPPTQITKTTAQQTTEFDVPKQNQSQVTEAVKTQQLPKGTIDNPQSQTLIQKIKSGAIKTKDDLIKWVKANKVVAGTLVFAAVASTTALIRSQQINSTAFRITSIRQDPKDPRYIEIQYNDSIKFTVGTTVNILSSNSLPSVNGTHEMLKTDSGKFSIEAGTITSPGDYGTFTCSTNYEKELGKTVNDLTSNITKPLTEFTKGFVSDYVDNINKIFDKIFSYWWVLLISSIFVVLMLLLVVFIR